MKGRMESKIRIEANIQKLLEDMPLEVTDYYLNIAVSREPKSCEEYVRKIRNFLFFMNENPKDVDVTKITKTEVARYLHEKETKIDSDGVKHQTSFSYHKQIHTVLNDFFGYLYGENLIPRNIMDGIKRPKKKDERTRKNLSVNDLQSMLRSSEKGAGTSRAVKRQADWKTRDKAILLLFMTTGMRETALSEINVDDVDFESNELTVIDKGYRKHVYKLEEGMRQSLLDWIADRNSKLENEECQALFISNRKTRLTQKSVANIVSKYAQGGLGYHLSPHKLRSAFCTTLYEETGDIEFVRAAVGHRDISTTQRYIVEKDDARKLSAQMMSKKLLSE